jgi:hypothetical protein
MTDINAMSEAIATQLGAIEGLRTQAQVRDIVAVPVAVVGPPTSIDYDATMRNGSNRYEFSVRVLVSRTEERAAQIYLAEYAAPTGERSIKAAIEADPSLMGTAMTTRVTGANGIGSYDYGDTSYLGVDFTVEVYA